MYIAIVNKSSRVSDVEVATIAAAVQLQARRDVAPAWDLAPPTVEFHDAESVPAGAARVYVVDSPDVADALGYHTDAGGVVTGFVFVAPVLDNGGTVLGDANDLTAVCVASVASHEIAEALVDSLANTWSDCGGTVSIGDATFAEIATEVADPVEGDSYAVDAGAGPVVVSNFVTPAYFDAQAPAGTPRDHLGRLTTPFSLDRGGYAVVRMAPGDETQVFGERMPAWKRAQKAAHGRGARRVAKR